RILLDDPGRGIEPAESTGEVPRVPHAAIWGDDDAVRPRCGSGRGVVRDLARRGIEPADVAVRLVSVPDDPVRADSGVVWYTDQANSYIGRVPDDPVRADSGVVGESLGARKGILCDNRERGAGSGEQANDNGEN